MKKNFLLVCFFLETSVIRQIPIKTNQDATNKSIEELIFNQAPHSDKLDSDSMFLNLRTDGLFFSSKHKNISSKMKIKLKKKINYFYKKNAIRINKSLLRHNKKTYKKKFKKIMFNKKNTHKNLIYNFNLAFKLFNLAKNEKTKNKWKKIHNLLKKQLLLFYLDKKLTQNLLFAYHSLKKISSKKNFHLWIEQTVNCYHFEYILNLITNTQK